MSVSDAPQVVGGPWFEDFIIGETWREANGLTLGSGHAALHQAVVGDRLLLALNAHLTKRVTGETQPLAHPNLVCDVAIGQSTRLTQRVIGNLFYRGLVLSRPVFLGETLETITKVEGLKQNRARPGAPATGLVALRIDTWTAPGEHVLGFWRCPMIPLRDPDAQTGHADDFEDIPKTLDPDLLENAVPRTWDLRPLRSRVPEPHHADLEPGQSFVLEAGETVTAAPELARLTLNLATAHTDASGSRHGQRLVYGGHTISVAAAHATRAIPAIATILAWESCDHLAPVFEGDVLRTELQVMGTSPLPTDHGTANLRALVSAVRGDDEPVPVLDWKFVALIA